MVTLVYPDMYIPLRALVQPNVPGGAVTVKPSTLGIGLDKPVLIKEVFVTQAHLRLHLLGEDRELSFISDHADPRGIERVIKEIQRGALPQHD